METIVLSPSLGYLCDAFKLQLGIDYMQNIDSSLCTYNLTFHRFPTRSSKTSNNYSI